MLLNWNDILSDWYVFSHRTDVKRPKWLIKVEKQCGSALYHYTSKTWWRPRQTRLHAHRNCLVMSLTLGRPRVFLHRHSLAHHTGIQTFPPTRSIFITRLDKFHSREQRVKYTRHVILSLLDDLFLRIRFTKVSKQYALVRSRLIDEFEWW